MNSGKQRDRGRGPIRMSLNARTWNYGSEGCTLASYSARSADIRTHALLTALASSRIADASASRLSRDNVIARLFSAEARSGRNAWGRAWASWRRMRDGFLDRGQGLLPPPQIGQAVGLVVQRLWRGRGGTRRGGPGRAGGRWRRLPRSRPGPPPAAPGLGQAMDWLFSDAARSGRNASGRAWASWR